MPVETAGDRLVMLNDFGVNCTYTPDGGASIVIKTILLNDYYAVDSGSVAVEMNQPIAVIRTADAAAISHNDTMVIESITYRVVNIRPDGTGISEIQLEQQ
jgi:hypothetical protein